MTAPLPGCYLCTAATNSHSKTGMMPPRPTLSANRLGLSDYISTPFCKHCAIATVGLQLSTQNALAVFYNHPAPYHPSLGEGTGVGIPCPGISPEAP